MTVFLARGYGGASVDEIAKAADVSKQTVYNHFGEDVKMALQRVGRAYLNLVLNPMSLALHRIIISEARRFPDLGPTIYNVGGARFTRTLADWLRARTEVGELSAPDAETAAENFCALLKGNRQVRALLGGPVERERRARDQAVGQALGACLRAYAP